MPGPTWGMSVRIGVARDSENLFPEVIRAKL
jgi:hypothetical protein